MLGAEHPDTLTASGNLADSLARQGKYDEAEKMQREVLALQKQVLLRSASTSRCICFCSTSRCICFCSAGVLPQHGLESS